jgi:transposase
MPESLRIYLPKWDAPGYKYRIYLTQEQEVLLAKSFSCCRWFWNYALNLCHQTYQNTGKSMVRNHKLAKAINDVGWGMFKTVLKYNVSGEGKVYIELDRFFPSSKTCHVCHNRVDNLTLSVRYWTCKHCGTHHDLDLNAAINIRNEALRMFSLGTRGSGVLGRPQKSRLPCDSACGGGVSRQE